MKRYVYLALLLVITCALYLPSAAGAYVTFNGHVLKGGVGSWGVADRYYYVFEGAQGYTSAIPNAVTDWSNTGTRIGVTTPVTWLKTTSQSASVMFIHAANYFGSGSGIIAETDFWTSGGAEVDEYSSNWHHGRIRLNTPVFESLSTYKREGSVAHEMGHVMGLDENNSKPGSVMCQLGSGRTVNNAQKDDANGINHLYPNG